MEFKKGLIVKSKAGHDKYSYMVVLQSDDRFSLLADGRRRTLLKPKKKNNIHLAATNELIPLDSMNTDKAIRTFLREYANKFGNN